MTAFAADIDEIECRLRDWCADHGHTIGPLGDVSEATASAMLGISKSTLRMQVNEGRAFVRPCSIGPTGWRRYALHDVAAQLAQNAQRALEW